jgi:hypothetical protein
MPEIVKPDAAHAGVLEGTVKLLNHVLGLRGATGSIREYYAGLLPRWTGPDLLRDLTFLVIKEGVDDQGWHD